MQEVGASETFPGTNVTTDAQIAASIRTFASSTWYHPTSTLSMMKRELGGVVDPELRVYGVKGLRVVDASLMPMIIGSHTSSTVYAVAEKVSRDLTTMSCRLCPRVIDTHVISRPQISSRPHRPESTSRRAALVVHLSIERPCNRSMPQAIYVCGNNRQAFIDQLFKHPQKSWSNNESN